MALRWSLALAMASWRGEKVMSRFGSFESKVLDRVYRDTCLLFLFLVLVCTAQEKVSKMKNSPWSCEFFLVFVCGYAGAALSKTRALC